MAETVTVTLESDDKHDELELPVAAVDLLDENDEGAPTVVGDLAILGVAQQLHGAIHHAEGEVGPEIEEAEQKTMDVFEERFGRSFAEMTGHDH
ncbi:MAG: hypothetical protein V5A52_07940 [Halovenus sp.]|uniref:DUF7545 family protein n=1 Tax=Halovenus amylolytica TaxID=2500550 RepID=UPI000FE37BEA